MKEVFTVDIQFKPFEWIYQKRSVLMDRTECSHQLYSPSKEKYINKSKTTKTVLKP